LTATAADVGRGVVVDVVVEVGNVVVVVVSFATEPPPNPPFWAFV
jgi:hypothetical protein